jgi:hypothetical protein
MVESPGLLDQWQDLLGAFAIAVWVLLALLAMFWVFLPFWLYANASRRTSRALVWSLLALLLPIVLTPIGLVFPRYLPLWGLGALVAPLIVLIVYLIVRASARVCPECGLEMRPEWQYCPRHPRRSPVGQRLPSPVFSGDFSRSPLLRPAAPPAEPSDAGSAVGVLYIEGGREAGRRIPISARGLTLGRSQGADVVLEDPTVSAEHARVGVLEGRAHIIDLASSNGTFVNDQPVDRAYLYDGDRLQLGDTILLFKESR